jgi:hypothetical protein
MEDAVGAVVRMLRIERKNIKQENLDQQKHHQFILFEINKNLSGFGKVIGEKKEEKEKKEQEDIVKVQGYRMMDLVSENGTLVPKNKGDEKKYGQEEN